MKKRVYIIWQLLTSSAFAFAIYEPIPAIHMQINAHIFQLVSNQGQMQHSVLEYGIIFFRL
jgi:hypothetical protein